MDPNPEFPFSLRWEIHDDLKTKLFQDEAKIYEDKINKGEEPLYYVDVIEMVPADSTLFKLYAMDKPAQLGGQESYIGDLILEGTLTSSKWADENLFFRHQKMDDDLAIKPEWKPYVAKWGGMFQNLELKCPFGYS